MAHKGIRQYTSDESSNILMGQTGFVILEASKKVVLINDIPYIQDANYPTSGSSNPAFDDLTIKCKQFPMVRCIDAGNMAAKSITGAHFTATGAVPAYSGFASLDIEVSLGDTYYGAFDEVWSGAGTILMVYLG